MTRSGTFWTASGSGQPRGTVPSRRGDAADRRRNCRVGFWAGIRRPFSLGCTPAGADKPLPTGAGRAAAGLFFVPRAAGPSQAQGAWSASPTTGRLPHSNDSRRHGLSVPERSRNPTGRPENGGEAPPTAPVGLRAAWRRGSGRPDPAAGGSGRGESGRARARWSAGSLRRPGRARGGRSQRPRRWAISRIDRERGQQK